MPGLQTYCQRLGVDGRQVIWASDAYDTPQHSFLAVYSMSSDGTMLPPITHDQLNLQGIADFAANPQAGGVFK